MDVLTVALPAFLASLVEFIEATTIVLAVGITRQWRSTLLGVVAAVLVLAAIVAVFGTAIVMFIPIELLRLVIGALLLVFGLQWLVKAILRGAGVKARRNEEAAFAQEIAELRSEQPVPTHGTDWVSFTVAFKGVLLEGLEVAFIVITFGASAGQLGPAVVGATVAGVLVVGLGVVLRGPIARVPENGIKFAVGLLLVTFGTFWAGEGIGIEWPGEDALILVLLLVYAVMALGAVARLRGTVAGGRRLRVAAGD